MEISSTTKSESFLMALAVLVVKYLVFTQKCNILLIGLEILLSQPNVLKSSIDMKFIHLMLSEYK